LRRRKETNYPEESIQHSELGDSLKSRKNGTFRSFGSRNCTVVLITVSNIAVMLRK
jgi:hypothetical protein